MGKNKLTWFRVYLKDAEVLEMLDAEAVYRALLASMQYLDEYETDEGKRVLSEMKTENKDVNVAFRILKKGADDSLEEYRTRVKNGKKAAAAKRDKKEALLSTSKSL